MLDTTETTPVYLNDEIYEQLKAKLTQLVAENFDKFGTDPETEVVMAMGEVGNIWPEFIRDDAKAA